MPLGLKNLNIQLKHKRKVDSLKFPLRPADFTIYAPDIGTLSDTVSSPLGRIYTPSQWGNYTTIACSITQSGT